MSQKPRRRVTRRRRRRTPVVAILAAIAGLVLLGAAIAALVAGGSSRRASIEVSGQPRLRVDKELVDLGDVRLGHTVDASFVLTNVGDSPLRFLEDPYIEVVEGC